jgi:DNA-binding MarR family transcriptional regulator
MNRGFAFDTEYELWVLLTQAYRALVRLRENELRSTGISMMQSGVLAIAKALDEPPTPTQISRWLCREPHTVSMLLRRMEKKGLIRRMKDTERRNSIRVILTPKGEEAYRRSRNRRELHRILASLSPGKRKNLASCLEVLRDKAVENTCLRRAEIESRLRLSPIG